MTCFSPRFLSQSSAGMISLGGLASFTVIAVLFFSSLFYGRFIAVTSGMVPLIVIGAAFLFLLAFVRMDAALVFLVFSMLLSPEIIVGVLAKRDIVIRAEDFLIVVFGMAWLARIAVFKNRDMIPYTAINGLVGVYCATFLLSTLQAVFFLGTNPVKASFYVLKYLEYFILFFIVAGTVRNKRQYQIFVLAFFLTFLIVNIYAASQIGHVDRVSAPFEGVSGEPNTLGGYQILMICIALGLFCHLRSFVSLWLIGGIVVFTFFPFMHTLSRASFIAIVPAYLALVIHARTPRRWFLLAVFVAAIFGAGFILPENVKERVLYTFNARPQEGIRPVVIFGMSLDPSASTRWWDWWEAVEYWKKQPFFGYGLAGKSFLDSQYVNNLVELGGVGFSVFAFLIIVLHRAVVRIYRTTSYDLVRGLSLGFLAGNIGLLVHALTANTFILIRIMEPYWFLAALILAWPRIEARLAEDSLPGKARDSVRKPGLRNVNLLGQVDVESGELAREK